MGEFSLGELRREIGSRLKKIRTDKRFTLTSMANMLGTSPSFLSEIENGKKFPSVKILYMLTQKLFVSLDYLVADMKKEEFVVPYIDEPDKYHVIKNAEYFIFNNYPENQIYCYEVKDNSMILEGISEKTVVIIHKTQDVVSGNIVLFNECEEYMLRKYYKTCDNVILCSENIEKNSSIIFEKEKHDILGKVISVIKYY